MMLLSLIGGVVFTKHFLHINQSVSMDSKLLLLLRISLVMVVKPLVMALLIFLISSAVVLLPLSSTKEFETRVLEGNVMMAIRLIEMVALPAASVRAVYPRV